jgi:hypothetical protein
VQLGEVGGGEGSVWVFADSAPALGGFAPRNALVIMDKEAAGSGGCCTTFHGRLGADVTISIDAVSAVFRTGLIKRHPICANLFSTGEVMQATSNAITTAAATEAQAAKAVQQVYERFEAACDDLDSGLFDLDQPHCYCCMRFFAGAGGSRADRVRGHVWCRPCKHQVYGDGRGSGGQHPEFAYSARPNDRCTGCPGCTA